MKDGSLLAFFALVFGLSLPFWLLRATTDLQLMPGLSTSALMTFCPMAAASIIAYRQHGVAGALTLLKRSFDFKRIKSKNWLVPVLLLMPTVSIVVYGLIRWMGMPLPVAQLYPWLALLMFIAFLIGALGEELGWSGYALEPMQARWGALGASLLLGLVGIAWHLTPLLSIGRPSTWIAWWCLYALTIRIFTLWLYNNTGKSVQRGTIGEPLSGNPLPMRFGGRFLVRNDRVVAP